MDLSTPTSPLPGDIHAITKKKLYRYARAMNVRRRACMNKKELWQAVTGIGSGIKFFDTNSPCHKKSPSLKNNIVISPYSTAKTSASFKSLPSYKDHDTNVKSSHKLMTNNTTSPKSSSYTLSPDTNIFTKPTQKLPTPKFTVNSAPIRNVTQIALKPFERLKYKSVKLNTTFDDVIRAVRKYLRLTLDYNITLKFLYYNDKQDIFGAEVQVTKNAVVTFYWVEFQISKNVDGYKEVTVIRSTKGLTTPPKEYVLIF